MSQPIQFHNHPFRFLLYLEWVLLGLSALVVIIPSPPPRFPTPDFPELTIFSLVMFGLMGLRLPTKGNLSKVLYTALEIVLIVIAAYFGGRTSRLFPFFNLILVTRSCLIFKFQGRLAVALLSFVLFLITLRQRLPPQRLPPAMQERFMFFSFVFAVLFALGLVFVLLLMNAVLSERESREKLARANEKLRQYALQIENQATLEERNRIAREIHDSLGHSLTALNLQLETALKLSKSDTPRAMTFLATAKELASKALQDVRHSVSTMRTQPLQEKSLGEAVGILAADFQRSSGILVNCKIDLKDPIPIEMNIPIYRIVQESITNIYKYAQASIVNIDLISDQDSVQLIVEDNGKGFNIAQNTTGFGLQSMRDRTLALGGEFTINSARNAGCKIIVLIPLNR
ncbi:MAG: sensor histidine kinase [Nostocales cyanobacterium]|nr:MAG: sensor histidine kinase [Nostocales cyanobacterium]TAF13588.1 MAG: sensor histidine kinase [Nostocales cyanobacterium]